MKTLALLLFLAVPMLAVAQDLSDGTALSHPGTFITGGWKEVRSGNYYAGAALLVIGLVAALRAFGERAHELIPDDSIWDKPLWFLFDTKPGRVLKLCLITSASGIGGAWALGSPITPALVNPILGVTFAASAIYGWLKDFVEWEPSERLLGAKLRGLLSTVLGVKAASA
jgi:hypothetical protein